MVDVVAEPEHSFLDEPLFGSWLTPRRLIYLVLAAASAYLVLRLPPGPRVWIPGLEVHAGIVHVVALSLLLGPTAYLVLVDGPVRPETQLLWLLFGSKASMRGRGERSRVEGEARGTGEQRREPRVVEKRVRLRLRDEVAVFSFVVSVDRPARVEVLVDGAVYRELSVAGERQVMVELEAGEHLVEVRSVEPPAVLMRYRVIVER